MKAQHLLIDALTSCPVLTSGVLALGNFDGVHIGHRAVVGAAVQKAREMGLPAYALTFSPHPYTFFRTDKVPFRLTTSSSKVRYLKEAGANEVVALAFTPELAALSADDFIKRILIESFDVKHVTIGFDYAFGAHRKGNGALLHKRLDPLGIGITQVPPCRDAHGEIISSTRIREALRAGEVELANELLGRPFMIEGEVRPGDKRGRALDMPTANMSLDDYIRPLYGVYAIMARRADDPVAWPGVANIGIRPTIGDNKELLEFHLFGCSGSFYGEHWEIELHHFLRPERTFANLEELAAQIKLDAQRARNVLIG